MEAARRAPAIAVTGIQITRPVMSKFGVFTVRKQIRRETREMLGEDSWLTGKKRRSDMIPSLDILMMTMESLTDSDRRRKPDY